MDTIGFYAGSFDPFTNGHLQIVKKATKCFSKVIVGIAYNSEKKVRVNKEKMKEAHGKLSTLNLIEYFELPKTQRAADYISNMRTHIKNTIKEAKEHFSKR